MVVVPEPPPSSEHRYGRGGFLLLVAGGASSLLWAGPVSRFLSPVTSAGSQLVGNFFPVGGWRIYTISGSMPIFDPSRDRKSTRLNSSHMSISYAVFCLK